MNTTLYEQDYYQWLTQTSQFLKTGDFSQLDLPNLIEEIDDMGISQRKAVSSNLRVVLWHLLKYKYQPLINWHHKQLLQFHLQLINDWHRSLIF